METLDAIRTRRSVRRYLPDPVDESTLRSLLEAAMLAPSAANEQPWQFVVIDDRSMLDSIPSFSPYASAVRGAPLGILVCADTRSLAVPGFWVQDCSAAVENLLLAAHALGLGAVWTGVYPLEDRVTGFVQHCRLPDGVVPVAFVVLGHPADHPSPEGRFRPDRVHRNGWGA
ncbi:MAG: nitroreductase family protein [Methanoregulaceae archaeon]